MRQGYKKRGTETRLGAEGCDHTDQSPWTKQTAPYPLSSPFGETTHVLTNGHARSGGSSRRLLQKLRRYETP
ncbi:MAG TPA: hypothetical protein VF438_01195, partial [Candidatus Paceibacterota bacterium]